jgi:uncharacterized protein (TIGR02453 family)
MGFTGWPVEAVELYEGLEADNTKAYWLAHKATYEEKVRAPMQALVDELGGGSIFRPYRDVRFSKDKSPYKVSCDAHVADGFLSLSADRLLFGTGLYLPEKAQLERYRAAVADDTTGPELAGIVAELRAAGYDVHGHEALQTAPRGYAKDHPRIELLRQKGILLSKEWPVGAWLGTEQPKQRITKAIADARPLNAWIAAHVT